MRRSRSLPDHTDDGGGDQEGFDAHVEEAVERGDAVGAVQRRQHEVTGECRLNSDARRIGISDLAHEDHVGVLTKNCLEAGGKGQAGLLVRLDLVDAGEHVLDRILDRCDVRAGRVDLEQRRVQRGRLTGAGRAGADDHAERGMDHLRVVEIGLAGKAELRQADHRSALVEDSHDDLLAEDRRHAGDADVDLLAVDHGGELTVLRLALLDDVHAAHDLQPARQRRVHADRQAERFDKVSVDAEADAQLLVEGFDVDVGGRGRASPDSRCG